MKHRWKLRNIGTDGSKYICLHCKATKIIAPAVVGYAKPVRYWLEGVSYEGKAPPCSETKKGPIKDPLTAGLA